jgi:hypothetical protein
MKFLLLATVTYTIFSLHASIARDLAISRFVPHLILAGLAVMTVRRTLQESLVLAAVWGLLADCLSEGRLGPGIVSFAMFALILNRLPAPRQTIVPWKLASVSIPLVWCVLLGDQFLHNLADGRTNDWLAVAIQAAGSAIYTGLVVLAAAYGLEVVAPAPTQNIVSSAPSVSNHWRMLTE